jgi:hypothetical protein
MDRSKRIMVKKLNADSMSLSSSERPIDYGHCCEIIQDKYGVERGLKMYESMIDLPQASNGLHFVAAEKIQKEKKAMHRLLNLVGTFTVFTYEDLYDRWTAAGRPEMK